MATNDTHFEISFVPSVPLVSVVRRFVTEFYNGVLFDKEAVSRAAIATHELLENGIRHGSGGTTELRIEFDASDASLTIAMKNRADEATRTTLAETFDQMRDATDPLTHYTALMRRNAKRTDGSGLGLARICAEAGMELDYGIDGDQVTLTATWIVGGQS